MGSYFFVIIDACFTVALSGLQVYLLAEPLTTGELEHSDYRGSRFTGLSYLSYATSEKESAVGMLATALSVSDGLAGDS